MFAMLNAAGINSYIISREHRARRGMAIINTVFPIGAGEGPHNTMGTTTVVIGFSTTPTEDLDHSCVCLFY